MKKMRTLLLILFLPVFALGPLNPSRGVIVKAESSAIIYVPKDFGTIQEAINNATLGDTISVSSGLYYERVIINKTVTLVGENMETTIVDGSFGGSVFQITADNVNVMGTCMHFERAHS